MANIARHKHFPIFSLLTAALVIGFFLAKNYGESWDEADIHRYSEYAINAYRFVLQPKDLTEFHTNLNLYGPGYYMAASLLARLFLTLVPNWSSIDAWHFVNFSVFVAGSLALYLLSVRWMSRLSAMAATLLFLLQPLFWGHAFINPKDIPFMALFTASIYAGLKMWDSIEILSKVRTTLITAAVLLGLTSSFRVLGPLAGLIVVGYGIYRLGARAIAPAVGYVGFAGVVTYLSWPYLWGAPIKHFLESFNTMAQFPFTSSILFADQLYKANQLPMSYFPTILAIQLTETSLLLAGAGLVISAFQFFKKELRAPFVLLLVWFVFPAALIIGSGSPLYDNARQLYFLLPPLFIVSGVAFEKLFAIFTRGPIRLVIILISVLPGILLGIRLHPYEYIYYNILVDGTGGAYRHFEMDYWGTSYKEITDHLNSVAPMDSKILVYGPSEIVSHYARPDIKVYIPRDEPQTRFDYVIFPTRANVDERRCKEAETIFSVGRRGAVFSLLKSIPRHVECN